MTPKRVDFHSTALREYIRHEFCGGTESLCVCGGGGHAAGVYVALTGKLTLTSCNCHVDPVTTRWPRQYSSSHQKKSLRGSFGAALLKSVTASVRNNRQNAKQ